MRKKEEENKNKKHCLLGIRQGAVFLQFLFMGSMREKEEEIKKKKKNKGQQEWLYSKGRFLCP